MSHFREAFEALSAGNVLCEISSPEVFHWLMEEGGLSRIDDHLRPLGRRVGATSSGRSFYLEWISEEDSLKSLKTEMREMLKESDWIDAFVGLLLEIDDLDGEPVPGRLVRQSKIAAAVDNSAAIRENMVDLAAQMNVRETTDAGRIGKILEKLSGLGYLKPVNRERQDYEVTGKIELHYDNNEYFVQHVGAVEKAVEDAVQESLF